MYTEAKTLPVGELSLSELNSRELGSCELSSCEFTPGDIQRCNPASGDINSSGLRPQSQRRRPPDRGIVLLDAKDRIGPKIWALYGKVDRPIVLKDDLYLDNARNDFYRDDSGFAFLLLPYAQPDSPDRFEIADAAYRRAVALGVTEKPEVFFTCVYQFQLPEFRCIHIHADSNDQVLEEEKCLRLMTFEKLRLMDAMGNTDFSVKSATKIFPVQLHCENPEAEPSMNLQFALNTLVLHHGYDQAKLRYAWGQHCQLP